MLKEFKRSKAAIDAKFTKAMKFVKEAENEFKESVEEIVTNASAEDLKEFMNSDEVTDQDKELIMSAYEMFNNAKIEIIELDDETLDKLLKLKNLLS